MSHPSTTVKPDKAAASPAGENNTTTAGDTSKRRRGRKPDKPYPDFPLFAHRNGQWAKKIRGKLHYFGLWADWQKALAIYQEQKDDLHAGRKPRRAGDTRSTLRDLFNRFLTSKKLLLDTGEITARTFADYKATCDRLSAALGLTRLVEDLGADDFEQLRASLAKSWGPVALGNEIQRVRVVFKYAYDNGLIAHPIRYGQGFKRPSRKTLRQVRAAKGPRLFEAAELRRIIDKAVQPLKAMILLGANCGFGNTDVGKLPLAALDMNEGWVNYPRPKTGVQRRCPLWPETMAALRDAIAKRPTPKSDAEAALAFITRYGSSWAKETCDNPVSKEMAKLLSELKVARKGLNFYALRHTFETIGGEARDQVAVDHIMGHVRNDMASVYRERVSDERLRAVTDFVRGWLFQTEKKTKKQ
ncbi:MAG: tyrosine-type recombinase/integrase [Gemmataceae bacterium]